MFHLLDKNLEEQFNFDNAPKRFIDVETGEHIDLHAENIKEAYQTGIENYIKTLQLKCMQYKIRYVGVDIRSNFSTVLNTFLVERQKFV